MTFETEALFRDNSYLKEAEGTVVAMTDSGGIILDRTIFYATSGASRAIPAILNAQMAPASPLRGL